MLFVISLDFLQGFYYFFFFVNPRKASGENMYSARGTGQNDHSCNGSHG